MSNFNFNSRVFLSLVVQVLFSCCCLVPLHVTVGQDGMPILQSVWDLPVPDLFYCDTSEFVFRFDMSTIVENYMTKLQLFRGEDCDIDIWDNNVSTSQFT